MANTKRRAEYTDRNGNMFIPMNVEGGIWNEHFITTPKLICIVLIIISIFIIITYLQSEAAKFTQYIIWIGIWAFISLQVLRFVVFEEKFYYKMYLELKDHEIASPSLFWDIASIKDTDEGAIMTYSDAKIGIMIKLERDTITGKNSEFKETHYDAISDFYREVATIKYSFIQMNIMEQAGKDPRLHELSKLVYKSDNNNICKLMEMEVGYIKNITHYSLYESDYFLFYTQDLSKVDTIIGDASECIFRILDGAYIGYTILSSKEIVDFVKEEYGVNYFNSTDASLQMFDRNAANIATPFNVYGIIWNDGEDQELTNQEINKIRGITSDIIKETVDQNNVSFKKTIYRKNTKNKIGVDFSKLSEGHNITKRVNSQQRQTRINQSIQTNSFEPKQINKSNASLSKQQVNNSTNEDDEEYIDL
jgi:hypothetical protein